MRNINEILADIQSGKWLRNKELCLALGKEFAQAYDAWIKTGHPTEYTLARVRAITRPLYRHVIIWEMDKPKQDRHNV